MGQPERVADILPRVWARLELGPLPYKDPRLEAFRAQATRAGWPTVLTLHDDDTVTVTASTSLAHMNSDTTEARDF